MKDLKILNFSADRGRVERPLTGEVEYTVDIPPRVGEYNLFAEGDISLEEFFVIEYSTMGWGRPKIYRKPCISCEDKDGNSLPLVCYDDMTFDGKRYTVAVKTEKGSYSRLKFSFCPSHRNRIEFRIHKMYTCAQDELPVYCADLITDTAEPFSEIDLSGYFNREIGIGSYEVRLGGGRFFDKEKINLHNIPFTVATGGKAAVAPPPPPTENEDIIDNFGVKAKRRICRPVSRDFETVISLGGRAAREIYFLMTVEGKRYQRCGFATGGTILGAYANEVTMPLDVVDIEGFAVEVVYSDGRRDLSLPLNIETHKHGIMGDISLYAIPADGSLIDSVIFRNRSLDTDFSLVALTINETEARLFPEMLIPVQEKKASKEVDGESYIHYEGSRLTLKSRAILMSFDLSRGLYLDRFENAFTPNFKFKPDFFIKMRHGATFSSDIPAVGCRVDADGAHISLSADGLSFELLASLDESSGILWNLCVKNNTDADLKQGIIFPSLSGIEFESREASRYFIPKYQNIDSNETVYVYEESAPSFPMQFLDVYSEGQNGGISLTTRERELTVRKYAFEKRESIEFYVEYPEMYGNIAAGEEFKASPTLITAHEGDWRASFNIYKSWLDSWYEPYHCQDKKWYRECFWLLAEITDFFETEEMCRFPIWYDKEKKEFNYLKILEEQHEISGAYPDILHMWAWSNRIKPDGKFAQKWGNFSESEYNDYGGLDSFRSALHEFMDKKGVYSSVYLHPTLLTDFYPQFEKYKHLRVEGAAGNHITIFGDSHRMCHANEEWRDYALAMYPRVYSELRVPILYVDEFSLRIGNRCFAKHHGHEVPSNLLKTDRNFITRLKDVMPHDVVLYGEYAAVDVNARYIDCNISYSIIDTVVNMIETAWRAGDGDDRFSRVMIDTYRFAFPKIVQLVLPMAMRNLSWHPQKFIFFNGEAIYDSFWDTEESRGHEFVSKAYKIKKKYADCFSSDIPETMIETLSPAICANKFPGEGRTVYTLYNRAYTTYRGPALKIKHTDGAEYYDAWNGEPLTPEIRDGYAEISLALHAQSIGCVAVSCRKA